jgi:hypothetical protein
MKTTSIQETIDTEFHDLYLRIVAIIEKLPEKKLVFRNILLTIEGYKNIDNIMTYTLYIDGNPHLHIFDYEWYVALFDEIIDTYDG